MKNNERNDEQTMYKENGNDKFLGIEETDLFQYFDNKLVFNGSDREDIYFKPTKEGKLDLLVYTTLAFNCNPFKIVNTNIKSFVTMIGYKPRSGSGRINERVEESFERLKKNCFIDFYYNKEIDNYTIKVYMTKAEDKFFKLNYSIIEKILEGGNWIFSLDGVNVKDIHKYDNRERALYLYCYLVSRMGYITFETEKLNICYPTMDEICKDNAIDKKTLIQLLTYFELDRILFTVNIGEVKKGENKSKATNYYVTNLDEIYKANMFAHQYYYANGYEYYKEYTTVKYICSEINDICHETMDKIKPSNLAFYKDHLIKEIKTLCEEINIPFSEFTQYESESKFIESKHKEVIDFHFLCFLMDYQKKTIPSAFYYHIRNVMKALKYIYIDEEPKEKKKTKTTKKKKEQ